MNKNENYYCIILAGGKGRRLWPCSRDHQPKQFMDFFGVGRTQLQQTFDRFVQMMPIDHIFVCTNWEFSTFVEEQLPELPKHNILREPVRRNTAPSVAWAAYRISHLNSKAQVIISPSDQAVFKDQAFQQNVKDCFAYVENHDCIISLAVKPTRPEPGYGYIQLGEETAEKGLHKIRSFTEKPEREFAQMFMESEEFYWNTGIFISNVTNLVMALRKMLPVVLRLIDKEGMHISLEEELAFVQENFSKFPNLSIDHGVLEQSEEVYAQTCDFGWADLGTWHSIYESMNRSENDNVVIDSEVQLEDCENNIIKLPKGRLGVIQGLNGYIVAERDNVLLICKKSDSSALVKKFANEVHLKYGEDFV